MEEQFNLEYFLSEIKPGEIYEIKRLYERYKIFDGFIEKYSLGTINSYLSNRSKYFKYDVESITFMSRKYKIKSSTVFNLYLESVQKHFNYFSHIDTSAFSCIQGYTPYIFESVYARLLTFINLINNNGL